MNRIPLKQPIETMSVTVTLCSIAYLLIQVFAQPFVYSSQLLAQQIIVTFPQPHLLGPKVLVNLDSFYRSIDSLAVVDDGQPQYWSDLCWKDSNGLCIQSRLNSTELSDKDMTQIVTTLLFNITSLRNQRLYHIWEQRLSALHHPHFYPAEFSLKLQSLAPDGSTSFDPMYIWDQIMYMFRSSIQSDLLILGIGFFLMHVTLGNLFLTMRSMGSHFTLAFAVLLNSSFSLILSLLVIRTVGISLNIVQVFQAIPFFVVTIGFEKPLQLTRAVIGASQAHSESDISLRDKILNGVNSVAPKILLDYGIEIMVMFAVSLAFSSQGMLGSLCFFGGLLLFFDAILLLTFYLSALTLKLEMRRVYLRQESNVHPENQFSVISKKTKTDSIVPKIKLMIVI
jgi:hypothetical protein